MTTILCIADRLQTGQEVELWREPQPGSLLTITCDSRCVILSSTWHSPRRCVITGDCHNLVSKSRQGLWPGLHCCQLWAFLKQSTYSVCGCRAVALGHSHGCHATASADLHLHPQQWRAEAFGGVEQKGHFMFMLFLSSGVIFGQLIPMAVKGDGTDNEEEIHDGKIQS